MALAMILVLCVAFADAQMGDGASCSFECCRPDGHAPAAVMTDHVHGKHRFNLGYMGMLSSQKDNVRNGQLLSTEQVLQTYAMAPTRMDMQMHMLMAGYGITGRITVMAMLQWMKNDMSMQMHPSLAQAPMPGMDMATMSANMSMKSSGIGDSRVYVLGLLSEKTNRRLIGGLGFSLPTGSISNSMTPMWKSGNSVMSYCMQNGSGSVGLLPSLTYIQHADRISFGGVVSADYWVNDNKRNYRAANALNVTAWMGCRISSWLSCSVRPEWRTAGWMSGYDANVAKAASADPTANTANYGGQNANAAFGFNFYVPQGACRELRISGEYVLPVYQSLHGVQMRPYSGVNVALQYTFM